MKATELRIGNWVEGNKPFQVKGGDLNLGELHEKLKEEPRWKPIPLTEEWLERFGFEKRFEKRYSFTSKDGVFHSINIEYDLVAKCVDLSIGQSDHHRLIDHIKHVHQLQNLYFALTGEELQTDETEKKAN